MAVRGHHDDRADPREVVDGTTVPFRLNDLAEVQTREPHGVHLRGVDGDQQE